MCRGKSFIAIVTVWTAIQFGSSARASDPTIPPAAVVAWKAVEADMSDIECHAHLVSKGKPKGSVEEIVIEYLTFQCRRRKNCVVVERFNKLGRQGVEHRVVGRNADYKFSLIKPNADQAAWLITHVSKVDGPESPTPKLTVVLGNHGTSRQRAIVATFRIVLPAERQNPFGGTRTGQGWQSVQDRIPIPTDRDGRAADGA